MMSLTARDLAVLTELIDTLLPVVEGDGPAWDTPGRELGLDRDLVRFYERLPHDRDRSDLRLLLALLRRGLGGLILYGRAKAFTRLDSSERPEAFRRIELHRLGEIRRGAKALKSLVATAWVTTEEPSIRPLAWDAMGYPGPIGPPPPKPKTIHTVDIDRDSAFTCDVVVVGSGAGGGTAAGVLASAGLSVIVVEAGDYRNESDFNHLEADAYRDMYLDGALKSTADGGIHVLSGATLGGGTVINYTTSFPTPHSVRREWDEVAGFAEVFTGDRYEESIAAVSRRFEVNRDNGSPSLRAQLLEKGLRELGWHVDEMPRNAVGCREEDCGYCTMGCRIGAKRSTLQTYLQDASDAGAVVITGAQADHVTTDGGRATGVIARSGGSTITIEANVVVLAAGSLNTPAILLRSGIRGSAVGDYLRLHPVTAVWARFDQRVDPWTGILQTRYSDEFADLDGEGYGFRFETAPVHPLFPAAFIGWEDGESFKRDVLGLGYLDVGGILLRDRGHGKVRVRSDGTPIWKYKISRVDQAHVREGVRRAAELYIAAGAIELISSTVFPVRWQRTEGHDLDYFMSGVDRVGYGSNQTSYFTFHQMGSARMGTDPSRSVVDHRNECHVVRGLFVMDGSCFPTSSGVNPMLSIAAIAHRGATMLAERLA
jgi:hypothetical protein